MCGNLLLVAAADSSVEWQDGASIRLQRTGYDLVLREECRAVKGRRYRMSLSGIGSLEGEIEHAERCGLQLGAVMRESSRDGQQVSSKVAWMERYHVISTQQVNAVEDCSNANARVQVCKIMLRCPMQACLDVVTSYIHTKSCR